MYIQIIKISTIDFKVKGCYTQVKFNMKIKFNMNCRGTIIVEKDKT